MRSKAPYHEETFSVSASRLADCVQNAFTLKYGSGRGIFDNTYSFFRMTDGETIHVLAQIGEIPMWDLAFVSTTSSATRVEVRPSKNIAGDPNYPSDMWQTMAQACR
jgi:hypothetical protein